MCSELSPAVAAGLLWVLREPRAATASTAQSPGAAAEPGAGRTVLGQESSRCCPSLHAPRFQGCSPCTAGLQLCYRELHPADFPTSAPQTAGDSSCLGHGR